MLRAVAAIIFGALALLVPQATVAALVLLFSAYMLADGIFAVMSGVRAARKGEKWGWFALEGVLNFAAGLAAFFWPGITVLAFVGLAAAWAILSGAVMLFGAFRFKQKHGRVWLAVAGIVSLVWGALLVISPITGAIVITLWLGAYAFVFGIFMLFASLRLRREAKRPVEPARTKVDAS
jgi:uncharacterized membrane protein HdeD (DUF308 family)